MEVFVKRWLLLQLARWLATGDQPFLQRFKDHQSMRDFQHDVHTCKRFDLPGLTPLEKRSTFQRYPRKVIDEDVSINKDACPVWQVIKLHTHLLPAQHEPERGQRASCQTIAGRHSTYLAPCLLPFWL